MIFSHNFKSPIFGMNQYEDDQTLFRTIVIESPIKVIGINKNRTLQVANCRNSVSNPCLIPFGHDIIGIEGFISETGQLTHFGLILWSVPTKLLTEQ